MAFNWEQYVAGSEAVTRESVIKAPFNWAGGKSKSLPYLLQYLPYRDGYIEPFGGSGAVLLGRVKSDFEVFNDRHSGIIAFYRCLRDEVKTNKLMDYLQLVLHSREEFVDCKNTWSDCTDDVERAAKWYVSIVMSFSSLGRNFGRSIKSGVNMAISIRNKIDKFPIIHERIKNVQIENQDAYEMLKDYDNKDHVFYLDPPYYDVYSGTYAHEMTRAEHISLLERVMCMEAFVAVSSYDNELYNSYDWDHVYEWEVPVSIKAMAFREENGKAGNVNMRTKATEKLYIKE